MPPLIGGGKSFDEHSFCFFVLKATRTISKTPHVDLPEM
jgi:hypothetical protein